MTFPTGRLDSIESIHSIESIEGIESINAPRMRGTLSCLLYPGQRYRMGRQGDCEILLQHEGHNTVSRYHAALETIASGSFSEFSEAAWCEWHIRDLGSANGTYVNDRRIEGSQPLRSGDRIQLSKTGPRFRFESLPHKPAPALSPGVTLTQLFPLLSTGSQLFQTAAYVPGIVTVAIGVSLFMGFGNPIVFNALLALYLAFCLYYIFIYRLCGKPKSWGLLLAMAGFTALLLHSPVIGIFLWFFRNVLPGETIALPPNPSLTSVQVAQLFSQTFLGTGLMEELLKALPVMGFLLFSFTQTPAWRQRWGLEDPLDGILLCTASAVGFTLMETLGQYVPHVTQQSGQLAGLQLLIPRLLGSIAGHLAYSGYFGYFIGLTRWQNDRHPSQQMALWMVGYGSAALLHTLWNVAGALSPVLLVISGLLSYSLLTAAILKARALSVR
ncbi:MAG: PrsW family glutamic-type intramembrane protease [Prochlorotrichaceae cyanobacterium]